ncbi:Poly(ADP-ribose) polymerase, catalytic domain-containing protein [Artemisia annua]|uniref:Poly(ADP-ribose) polymerase, catalytic domain-containing protein n=1 Tax=Artemisia annua TaxID=35608 RepID=A0A2U1P9Y5_ARTAN|nr:Poly(ADP-ribose) polymerase, catalytic domain-containing protein [Artemisia annua]
MVIEGYRRPFSLKSLYMKMRNRSDNRNRESFSNPTKLGSGKSLAEMMSRKQWEVLEVKIGTWIHFMCIAVSLEVPNHMWKQVKLQFTAENEVCDQMFDDLVSPKKYIIWSTQMNTHILLEFVISFKTQMIVNRSQVNGVRLGKPVSPWISIPDLIANLSKMLHFLGASIWELCFASVESSAVSNITLDKLKSFPGIKEACRMLTHTISKVHAKRKNEWSLFPKSEAFRKIRIQIPTRICVTLENLPIYVNKKRKSKCKLKYGTFELKSFPGIKEACRMLTHTISKVHVNGSNLTRCVCILGWPSRVTLRKVVSFGGLRFEALPNGVFLLGEAEKMSGVYFPKAKVRGRHTARLDVTARLEPLTTN